MTQYTPPPESVPYAVPFVVSPSERPRVLTVLGILATVLASLGLVGILPALVQQLIVHKGIGARQEAMMADPVLQASTLTLLLLGIPVSALHLAGGIGLLKIRPWARKTMITYAISAILFAVFTGVMMALVNIPHTLTAVDNSPPQPGVNPESMRTIMKVSLYAGLAFLPVRMIWPGIVIYFMTRPKVKDALAKTPVATPPAVA